MKAELNELKKHLLGVSSLSINERKSLVSEHLIEHFPLPHQKGQKTSWMRVREEIRLRWRENLFCSKKQKKLRSNNLIVE